MSAEKKRNYLFDNVKVLLIFFVVTSHFIRVRGNFNPGGIDGIYYTIAFSFIMQGFFFISGYFSKNVMKCHMNAAKNFLLPYFIMTILMYGFRYLLYGHATLSFLEPSHALWFLLVMFMYRFTIPYLAKIPMLLSFSLLAYLFVGCFGIATDTLAIGRMISFFVFFIAGFNANASHFEKLRSIPKRYTRLLLVFLLGVSCFLARTELIPVEMWHLSESFASFGINNTEGVFIRLLLLCLSILWLIVIFNLVPDQKLSFSYIGRYTMEIYAFHIPIRYIIKRTGIPMNSSTSILICFYLAFLAICFFSSPKAAQLYNEVLDFTSRCISNIKNIVSHRLSA